MGCMVPEKGSPGLRGWVVSDVSTVAADGLSTDVVAQLLQLIGAEDYEAEKRVVVPTIDPGVVGERWAHAAAPTTAMATIAAG